MAIAFTSLGSAGNTANAGAYGVALARAPDANTLVLVSVTLSDVAGTATDPTAVASDSLVFSMVTSQNFNDSGSAKHNLSLWRSMSASPDGSRITVTRASSTGCAIQVTEVSGVSTSGTSGANAAGQSARSFDDTTGPSIIVFGPSAASTANAWFSCFGQGDGSSTAFASLQNMNWELLDGALYDTPASGVFSGYATLASGTSSDWTVGGSPSGRAGIILEIVADNPAGGGAVISPYYASYYYPRVVAA